MPPSSLTANNRPSRSNLSSVDNSSRNRTNLPNNDLTPSPSNVFVTSIWSSKPHRRWTWPITTIWLSITMQSWTILRWQFHIDDRREFHDGQEVSSNYAWTEPSISFSLAFLSRKSTSDGNHQSNVLQQPEPGRHLWHCSNGLGSWNGLVDRAVEHRFTLLLFIRPSSELRLTFLSLRLGLFLILINYFSSDHSEIFDRSIDGVVDGWNYGYDSFRKVPWGLGRFRVD